MRAGRLIAILLALQHRGRMTAAQLAAELEVSQRTVLRDVQSLSQAGVPIYATQGAGGGIELLDGFQTKLTGLTPQEAAAVQLVGQHRVATALGLGVPAASARRKLLRALPESVLPAVAALDTWFLHDPLGPGPRTAADDDRLRRLARAIAVPVEVQVQVQVDDQATGRQESLVLRPLGLVLHAGQWLLVHLGAGGPQVLGLGGLTGACEFRRRFARPPDFDLAAFWRERRDPGPGPPR